jgi:hypothetical protein
MFRLRRGLSNAVLAVLIAIPLVGCEKKPPTPAPASIR